MFDTETDSPDTNAVPPGGAQRRMGQLRELSEIGLRHAQRLDRQGELAAIYSETCAVPEHLQPPYARRLDEIGRAFAQVARAVALTVALEDRIESDLRAGPAAAAERALRRELLAQRVRAARSGAPAEADGDDAQPARTGPAPNPGAPATSPAVDPDLRVRLDRLLDGGLGEFDAWLKRPTEEVIAHIREELGLAAEETPAPPRSPPSGGSPATPVGRGEPPGAATPSRDPSRRGQGPRTPQSPARAPARAGPAKAAAPP